MNDIEFLKPENNIVNRNNILIPAVSENAAAYLLDKEPRIHPENGVMYLPPTNEIAGAFRYKISRLNNKGQKVEAEFSEHGAQLVSLTIDGHQVVYQGTFGRIDEQDRARGFDPIGIPQLGIDGLKMHRMHGVLEASLTTFEFGLSDFEKGRMVFSIKGEEFVGKIQYPNTVFYIIHSIDDDGGVITSIQIFNDSKKDLHLAPGMHRYTKRHPNSDPVRSINVEGVEIRDERHLLKSIDTPTHDILKINSNGEIEGISAQFNDERKVNLNILPLTGYLGRDATITVWSDRPDEYGCVEMTWSAENSRGMQDKDYLLVPKGGRAFISLKQLVTVES